MDFFILPSWLVVVVVVAVLTIIYLHYSKDNRRKFGLPGPPPLPVFGNIIDMFKYGLCDLDRHFIKMYGKVFALSTGVFGHFLGDIVIADTEMLKEVMVKQASIFSDRNADPDTLVTPFDQSVFSVRGEHWKQMRSTLTPTFSSGKLRRMEAMILKCANTLIKNLKKKAEAKESFDNSVWGCYTMDVICATAFGIEVDSLNNPNHPYVTNAERANSFKVTDPAVLGILFFPRLMKKLQHILRYVPGFRGVLMSFLFFGNETKGLLKEREHAQEGHYNDFLQLMLTAHTMSATEVGDDEKEVQKWKKKSLTTEEIAGNGLLFFSAGHGTASDTLGFTTYLLAAHPGVQQRLIEEIDDVLQGTEPSYDNVSKLTYLEQVLNEAMRLYPVGFRMDRVPNQDTTVNGLFIPKGTCVIIPIYAIHMDPEKYPDPEKFDPERFTPEAKAKRNPYWYMPFGMGPRNCIGMRLALLEMKIILVKVLQNFTLKTCAETQIPLVLSTSKPMKPEKPIVLKVEGRNA
ncbi:cytochrome P450 3A4-like [Lingula anatina]|uniref:Cytochrome P450 3A4-like n=1 Tax=Lingula anatina TaxID=7574 RepID=A0A1S3HE81_LINAN|nr:cytochrome P450 3A4-like [Lingula anatina]|eukprot:XP_013383811.1 cytochrome P450 3A4-like [Lingula anatina]